MGNPWMDHVKKTQMGNKDLMKKEGFKAILKLAGKTYKRKPGAKKPKQTKKNKKNKMKKNKKMMEEETEDEVEEKVVSKKKVKKSKSKKSKSKRMESPWNKHVKKTMLENPKLLKSGGLKAILPLAAKTYKK